MPKLIKIVRALGLMVCVVTYAMLVHYVNTYDGSSPLAAVLALIPIFILVFSYTWKSGSQLFSLSILLILTCISWFLWSTIKRHTGLVFWMLDVGLMLALMMTFGRTLLPGCKPLCVHFAEIINQGPLPVEHEIYARRVTMAWVVFFAAISVTSTLLFFLTPLTTWSLFVNFLTLPLVALMFICEFLLRRRLLTNLPVGHALDAVKAYLNQSTHVR